MSQDNVQLLLNTCHKLQTCYHLEEREIMVLGRNLRGKILEIGLMRDELDLNGWKKEKFKMRIQESKMWSWHHKEIAGSRATVFGWVC